jgi:predicted ATPase
VASQEDIQLQQELLATHRRTLAHLIRQAAAYGGETYAPTSVANGMHEARENIARITGVLRGWGVAFDEHPNDESPDAPRLPRFSTFHQLRFPVSDFVGHAQTVDHLVTTLSTVAGTGRAALAAIRGMGGAGKTELTLLIAQRLIPHFPDGQALVELHGASDRPLTPEQALQVVIRVFQPHERLAEDRATLEVQYRTLLGGKRVLILADDVKDAAQIRPLIPPAGCALLLTSRSRFALPGLQSDLIIDLEGLPAAEAITLLRAICPRVQDRAFELAQRCAFLPLALRVSASLLASDATRRLDRYLRQLADERERLAALRDPDDPTLDVAASLALSYDTLDAAAQATLRQCAVFPGSFDAAAAHATIMLPVGRSTAVEDVLGALYRRSLVGYDSAAERYQLHDLVRVFAWARLEGAGLEDMRQRHAEYYLALAQPADVWQTWFERLAVEYPNIRAALDWSFTQDDDDTSVQIVSNLFRFWRSRGQITEGRGWVERALQRATQAPTSVRALLLSMAGRLAVDQEDLATARRYYTEGLELRQELGEWRSIAVQIGHLSWISFLEGDLSEARQLIEQALETYQELGLQSDIADALVQLASITVAQRSYAEAQRLSEEALALSQSLNDRFGIASALLRLGRIADAQGDDALAQRYFEESLAFFGPSGRSSMVAFTQVWLGRVVFRQGDVNRAYTLLEESAAIYTELGNLTRAAHALDWLSWIAFVEGHDQADQYATQCLELYRAIQDSPGIAKMLLRLGDLARKHANQAAAFSHYRESLSIYQICGDQRGQIRSLEHLAVLAAPHAPERAASLLAAAKAFREEASAPPNDVEREEYERIVSALRAELGDAVFTAAWDAGQKLSLEQALAEARLL